jgi:hypothetical protein
MIILWIIHILRVDELFFCFTEPACSTPGMRSSSMWEALHLHLRRCMFWNFSISILKPPGVCRMATCHSPSLYSCILYSAFSRYLVVLFTTWINWLSGHLQHDRAYLLNFRCKEEGLVATTATSSSSAKMPAQPWRCLSSSPIWALPRLDWGITFYTRIDLEGSYHTYPHVGGPFQSLQEAYNAIDRYLQEHQDPTM